MHCAADSPNLQSALLLICTVSLSMHYAATRCRNTVQLLFCYLHCHVTNSMCAWTLICCIVMCFQHNIGKSDHQVQRCLKCSLKCRSPLLYLSVATYWKNISTGETSWAIALQTKYKENIKKHRTSVILQWTFDCSQLLNWCSIKHEIHCKVCKFFKSLHAGVQHFNAPIATYSLQIPLSWCHLWCHMVSYGVIYTSWCHCAVALLFMG